MAFTCKTFNVAGWEALRNCWRQAFWSFGFENYTVHLSVFCHYFQS